MSRRGKYQYRNKIVKQLYLNKEKQNEKLGALGALVQTPPISLNSGGIK